MSHAFTLHNPMLQGLGFTLVEPLYPPRAIRYQFDINYATPSLNSRLKVILRISQLQFVIDIVAAISVNAPPTHPKDDE